MNFSAGLPETVLPPDPLDGAFDASAAYDEVAQAVARHPRSLFGWAELGARATDPMTSYAFFRVGYHRGLDALRAAGWRGSGYVRAERSENLGFLRCLDGLRRAAHGIGEDDEAQRCAQFLSQLDPSWPQS